MPDSSVSLPPAPVAAKKTWSVGTLTYTTGGLVALFCWMLWGDFAWSMRDRSVGPIAHWYLNNLGVPNLVFGLLLSSFPSLIAIILCPIISVKSDRYRSRYGRRIPFLLITTPFGALGIIGLAVTPYVARWMHGALSEGQPLGLWLHRMLEGTRVGTHLFAVLQDQMIVTVICFTVFWAAFEFATAAGNAVFGGLINDVVPKQFIGRFYGLFRAVSLIDGMIFNYWLIGKVPRHYTIILASIGVFYGVAFMWVCLKVKEGNYPPPPAETSPAASRGRVFGFIAEARKYFRECFTHPYYIAVFVMMAVAGLSFGPINTYSIPYARSLGMDMETYGKYLTLTFFISLGLSFFLGWLADTFHPLRMAMFTLAGYALVTAWGALFAKTPTTFLIAWVLHGVLSGCYLTTAASIWQRLLPRSRYAQFASAAGLCAAFASMITVPTVGLVIDLTGRIYRYTFASGCALSLIALGIGFHVYVQFLKFGGPKNYTAPE